MDENSDPENQLMIEESFGHSMEIDSKRARFPCCIVWTPLPVLSWLIPFIGHIGICREDGVILDFAGPNFVCVDNFAFGAVRRYFQINEEKECCISSRRFLSNGDNGHGHIDSEGAAFTWDNALLKSTQEFQHHSYNLLTCNCHSFVANNLNRLKFRSRGWNVVNLAVFILLKGTWVSRGSMVQSFLPFVVATGLGLAFGGTTFITFWAILMFSLVGWFLLGTYCFKNLIRL